MLRATLVTTWLLTLAPADVRAQNPTGDIVGTVRDLTGAPVAFAEVRIVGTDRRDTTNLRGEFHLTRVPAGLVRARAALVGFVPLATMVAVRRDDVVTVDIRLPPRSIAGERPISELNPPPHATDGSIAGQLRDSVGQPLAATVIRVVGAAHADTSDLRGEYRLGGLSPSEIELCIIAPGSLPIRVGPLRLEPYEDVRLTVWFPSGSGLSSEDER